MKTLDCRVNIIKKGYRVVFDTSARAWDYPSKTLAEEFTRKVRTLSGNYQAFARMPYLFSCKTNPLFFQFISHKFFRLLTPYFLLMLLFANFFLDSFGYRLFFLSQLIFYSLSFISLKWKTGMFECCGTFLLLNYAVVCGLYKFLTKSLNPSWKNSNTTNT